VSRKKADDWSVPEHWPVQDPARYRPLAWFEPYPNNPRIHPPEQIALLAELLKTYGPDQDIVVDEDQVILKGHGRLLAAVAGGLDCFLFTQRFGLSDADKLAMRIADNQVALLATWDRQLTFLEIGNLKNLGYDLSRLGFGATQLVQFTTTPGPPAAFPRVGADLHTDFECPACRHKWSGKPRPDAE